MKTYTHLLKLGEQARTRIAGGEPRSNLVSAVDGVLSEGAAWCYPHASDLFSLDEASFWTAERVAEYEQSDREHADAMARYAAEKTARELAKQKEAARREAMTDLEREVEDAILSSPQFRAFVNNGAACRG